MTQVAGLIRRLSDMGKVIFIVTHDFEFVSRTCSRILHFDEGEMPDDVPVTMDALPTDVYKRQPPEHGNYTWIPSPHGSRRPGF